MKIDGGPAACVCDEGKIELPGVQRAKVTDLDTR